VAADLTGFYGPDADLRAVTPAAAHDLRKHYLGRELASATVARRLKMCRMMFGHAVARGIISADPFAGLKGPPAGPNADRQHYVSRGDARRVLAVCNPDWQLIVAVSRSAGLRAPSEVFSLRWADVNMPADRMVVRSPKTERHAGGASRVVPIFPTYGRTCITPSTGLGPPGRCTPSAGWVTGAGRRRRASPGGKGAT